MVSFKCPKCTDVMSWISGIATVEILTRVSIVENAEGGEFGIVPGGRVMPSQTTAVDDTKPVKCPSCNYSGTLEEFERIYTCPHCNKEVDPQPSNWCQDIRGHACQEYLEILKARYCSNCVSRLQCVCEN